MRKLQFIVFGLILLCGQTLFGNIINIPDDYPTIQQGIDASVNGDTVLVDTGTYVENINYNGKNITVASLFFTTQDTSYISQTVIDGDSLDSVVKFVSGEDSTSVLCGLTITNGSADCGGGIYCDFHSSPSLENVTIIGNSANSIGGGICCDGSSPSLENVTISDNSANYDGGGICSYWSSSPSLENVTITGNSANSLGGGIYCYWFSSPSLENVTIIGNSANSLGGGIYCTGSCSPSLENVTITGNSANSLGGGIYCEYFSSLFFSTTNRCNIYSNTIEYMRGYGADIFTVDCDPIDIIVDTFTVLTPTDYYASPIDNYTFDILHSVKDNLINSDVYVSVDGDDSNTGTSADEPFRTIKHALSMIYSDSLNINTIHLSPGVYSDSTNGEIFPIVWSNYVNLQGSGEDETILDAHHTSHVLEFYGVSIVLIEEITITNGSAYYGGGVYCYNSSPSLVNVTITGNGAYYGGGVYCKDNSSPSLVNVTVTGNSADSNGGGVNCKDNSSPSLVNVTITGNSAANGGGGIHCEYFSSPGLDNVTITGNSAASNGGGVNCKDNSSPSLVNVTINNNSVNYFGGGIYCRDFSSPGLENVTITGNSAASNGGGGYCKDNSSPSLVNVTITCNSARAGGGLFCQNASPILQNVTITGNSTDYYGGGICCNYYSSPSLVNSIVSDNTGNYGIYNFTNYPGNPTITYSDFYNNEGGNFYGVNDSIGVNVTTNANGDSCDVFYNIQLDPLFVDPLNGDYHLSWANYPIPDSTMSPCIDAGDPDSPLDPDGTRNDMGAYYFDQSIIELSSFTASYVDDYILICWTTAWETDVMGFNIYRSEYNDLSTTGNHINSSLIPGHGTTSEPHNYEFADATADVDSTYYYWLEVISFGGLSYIYGSIVYEPPFGVDECITSNTFYLYQNYPNPFSTSTAISFSLKEKSHVKLSIYNLKGQLLETLVDDFKLAGSHTVEWDSEDISSGIYFYKLSTKDKIFINKMILLK